MSVKLEMKGRTAGSHDALAKALHAIKPEEILAAVANLSQHRDPASGRFATDHAAGGLRAPADFPAEKRRLQFFTPARDAYHRLF